MSDYYPPPQNQPPQYGQQPPQYGPAPGQSGPGYWPPQGQEVPSSPYPQASAQQGQWAPQGQGAPNPSYPSGSQGGTNGMSITGFVLGLVSLVFVWIPAIGIIGAVLGIIFSAVGMRAHTGSKGLAIAGLVLAIIAAAISLCVWGSLFSILAHL